jgi:REP element-mobilizing transposase RayT
MPEYRRTQIEGGTFYFTVLTYNHLTVLTSDAARRLLRQAWLDMRE